MRDVCKTGWRAVDGIPSAHAKNRSTWNPVSWRFHLEILKSWNPELTPSTGAGRPMRWPGQPGRLILWSLHCQDFTISGVDHYLVCEYYQCHLRLVFNSGEQWVWVRWPRWGRRRWRGWSRRSSGSPRSSSWWRWFSRSWWSWWCRWLSRILWWWLKQWRDIIAGAWPDKLWENPVCSIWTCPPWGERGTGVKMPGTFTIRTMIVMEYGHMVYIEALCQVDHQTYDKY